MTREKKISLTKYLNQCQERLKAPVPEKHKHRPTQYKELLEREIYKVNKTLSENAN